MPIRYQLTLDEFAGIFCQNENNGFSEEEIAAAESRLGVNFPKVYRSYLLTCGKDPINQEYNQLFTPDEITTSYKYIREIIASGNFSHDDDDPYYQISRIPQNNWHTITENYLLIWSENQGVWTAGYRLSDLHEGITDPPVYIAFNDSFTKFRRHARRTDDFFIEALIPALPFDHMTVTAGQARHILESEGIDPDQLAVYQDHYPDGDIYSGTCLDYDHGRFYHYLNLTENDLVQLTTVDTHVKTSEI